MDGKNQRHIRVKNCIGTIIDVHKTISEEFGELETLMQFEELREAIEELDMSLVSEGDVLMVERATNDLLKEFRTIFEGGEVGPVYRERTT